MHEQVPCKQASAQYNLPEYSAVAMKALAGGTTGVVLSEDDSGGSALYDAACRLQELLRGRAALLVVDRTDIVDAAEADGVLLSPRGVVCLQFCHPRPACARQQIPCRTHRLLLPSC
jgi:thiamine monophosphate synthase